MNKKVLVAKVISAFGIKGEVKIVVFLEDYKNIEKYHLFDINNQTIKLCLSNKNKASIGSNSVRDFILIAKINDINDRNKAELIRGMEIFTDRSNFKENKKNEFYIVDLIGLDVIRENIKIGKVINVFNHGAGAIIEIEFNSKNIPKGYQNIENFPFKDEFFPKIDIENGSITIVLPEMV
jgi:16S rRNA processing protein RimM